MVLPQERRLWAEVLVLPGRLCVFGWFRTDGNVQHPNGTVSAEGGMHVY